MAGLSRAIIAKMPHVPVANYAYRNNGDLTFTNQARAWGLAQPGFSNGATYADLNNSGALDLVVNRIDAPAAIYRNRSRELNKNHYLQVVLRGSGANTAGIGATVVVRQGGTTQLLEQMPTRGFQSSVDPRLHFGLGLDHDRLLARHLAGSPISDVEQRGGRSHAHAVAAGCGRQRAAGAAG